MVGFLQIIIYLLCIYLVYKGVEIFQIAFQSQSPSRKWGMTLGIVMTGGAIVAGITAVVVTELMAQGMMNNMQDLQRPLNIR